jgi:hypothetical protein
MTFVRDLSGNNPTDVKYSPYSRVAADLTAILALTPLYVGEIVCALNTGRMYRALGGTNWGLIGPVTSVIAGTIPQPSVTINQAAGQSDPALFTPILYTVVFNQDVTGFVTGDVSFTGSTAGGTLVGTVSGGPISYTVTVTGMTTSGTVIASVPASVATGVGGPNLISTSTDNTVTWAPDVTKPSVTINKAAGQADPTSVSPITFTIVFDEPVTGFIASDVTVTFSGTGTPVFNLTGTGPTYSLDVSGMTGDGNVTASIAANVCQDLSGNLNNASTSTDNIVAWVQPVGAPDGQLDFSSVNNSGLLSILEDI